ncbi:beta-N-acetylhexosaminidase [Sphaerospermopsis kisseleviana CS-549]|uniref:beta-N-acetylhexosaminidase n=1 Tax=Sphaerospermopsis kisseleviana CS-549 TaxID=3021783 RepID=A0ABT4ZKW1_9CYAN|nr:beta-N-acetylhexosaminidase [Sphaerospermopsis kisseleviana]MDB9440001.1 beta-N-acetylhexosaminidase [Sphaerospermopsis kisseleviana CS-549]BAZ83476.1 family 3 glycoside hydrolase domain-containing protein [Sphaerospermopsis kisseleviana NIES-73]
MKDLQKFGNHLILGVSGTTLSDDDKRALSELKPVGVIFFAKNFLDGVPYPVWLEKFKDLLKQIKEYTERKTLFTSLDHEGGRVVRTPFPITRFPCAYLVKSQAYQVAKATSIELKSLGINLSFSPVADIFSNPQNPIIGSRAFGITPKTASQSAREYYQGLREEGILGCAKHFPGHGDTSTDSHLELPILNLSLEDLRNRELIPFQALIQEQIPLIMTAHILFPQIDPEVPATLSKTILNHILRQELNFKGVIVSDDLDMKAVADMFMRPGTVARAFNAGCDLFIVSRNINSSSLERTYKIAEDFTHCLSNGSLNEEIVEAARARVENLLEITPLSPVYQLEKEVLFNHAELAITCCFE